MKLEEAFFCFLPEVEFYGDLIHYNHNVACFTEKCVQKPPYRQLLQCILCECESTHFLCDLKC